MGEWNASSDREDAEAGVSRSLAAPAERPSFEEERPLAALLLCTVMAAGAFAVPMWVSLLFWEAPQAGEGIESTSQMQSMVRRPVVVKPPTLGPVFPALRVRAHSLDACVDPGAWESGF